MLIYHPAFDIYHCSFRLLRLLENLSKEPYEVDRLRILDFYLLFPTLLQNFTLPRTAISYRKTIKALDIPYERIEDPFKIFLQIEPLQSSALRCLASYDIIDADQLSDGKILRTEKHLPKQLKEAINKAYIENPDLLNFLTGPLFDLDFYGQGGLKARSGLVEHRYDPQ